MADFPCVSVQARKLQLTEEGGSDSDDSLAQGKQESDKGEVNIYRLKKKSYTG